jgi:hypothetical protein
VSPLQPDSPETIASTLEETPAGFGLSASSGVPEHETGIVVVEVDAVVDVVARVVVATVVLVVVIVVVVEVVAETVNIAFVLLFPFTQAK